jgi:cellulose synthase/poly-beta-1,6-N-acetylglucosamine synthase-like glycosyltransferase
VVVPARDEAEAIAASMDALLMADYAKVFVLAIDDRSTDGTGAILDAYAAKHPRRIGVIHITELPEGWLGKTHAMQVGYEATQADFVLFTDADVLFSPSILRRTMTFAVATEADHVVVMPTTEVRSHGEGMILGMFQMLGYWALRPWKVEDPRSRDAIGVGAFNLVRRTALEEMGGMAPQRLTVLEDITLGRRVKAAGLRQRMAFAPGLILVHWAKGARGLIGVMTKNLFASFGFNPLLMGGLMVWMAIFFLGPLAGLVWVRTMLPSLLILVCIASMYRTIGAYTLIPPRYGWVYPAGMMLFFYAMLRSMVLALWNGGVEWRGTLYPLSDLRRHNSPFQWRREQLEREHRVRRAAPSRLRRWLDRKR